MKYVFILSLCFTALAAQSVDRPLLETDVRVDEWKKNSSCLTERFELKLRYSGRRGNYVVFYDLEGHEFWVQYREDRFDQRSERNIADLIEGQAYQVEGEFQGIMFDLKKIDKKDQLCEKYIHLMDSVPLGKSALYRSIQVELILF